jgi:hypothetical protein
LFQKSANSELGLQEHFKAAPQAGISLASLLKITSTLRLRQLKDGIKHRHLAFGRVLHLPMSALPFTHTMRSCVIQRTKNQHVKDGPRRASGRVVNLGAGNYRLRHEAKSTLKIASTLHSPIGLSK